MVMVDPIHNDTLTKIFEYDTQNPEEDNNGIIHSNEDITPYLTENELKLKTNKTPIEARSIKTIKKFFITILKGLAYPFIGVYKLYKLIASLFSKTKQQEELIDKDDKRNRSNSLHTTLSLINQYETMPSTELTSSTSQTEGSRSTTTVEIEKEDKVELEKISENYAALANDAKTQQQCLEDKAEREKNIKENISSAENVLQAQKSTINNINKLSNNDKIEVYCKFFSCLYNRDESCFSAIIFIQLIENSIQPFEKDIIIGLKAYLKQPKVTKDQLIETLENILSKGNAWLRNTFASQKVLELEEKVKCGLEIYSDIISKVKNDSYDFESLDQDRITNDYTGSGDIVDSMAILFNKSSSENKLTSEEQRINNFMYIFNKLKEDTTEDKSSISLADLDLIMKNHSEANFKNELIAMLKIYNNSTEVTTDQIIETFMKLSRITIHCCIRYHTEVPSAHDEINTLNRYAKIYQDAYKRLMNNS